MACFGLDFGLAESKLATPKKGGVTPIINDVSKRETPSCMSFTEKERQIGEHAQPRNPRNSVLAIKRLLGIVDGSAAADHEKKFLFNATREDDQKFLEVAVQYKFEQKWFKPEQLVAMLFTQLRQTVEKDIAADQKVDPTKMSVTDVVCAVPVYYTSTQRRLLWQALQIAGLNPLTIINETTAAALDYGIYKDKGDTFAETEKDGRVVCLVDSGHSATTISTVVYCKGQLKVLGHVWDMYLGGRDFDAALLKHYVAEATTKYKLPLDEDKRAIMKMLISCEKMKKVLSANQEANFSCELPDADVSFPRQTREHAESLWGPLIERMQTLVEKAKALPGFDRISSVEVIGGNARIPCLKQILTDAFGKPLSFTLDASGSISKGCAIMAAMLSPKFKVRDFLVVDANTVPMQLGYFSERATNQPEDPNFPGVNKKMSVFKVGDPCPKTLNLTFDREKDFDLNVFYDEAAAELQDFGTGRLLGKWRVSDLPKLQAGGTPSVKVRLRMTPSMLVHVEGATVQEEYEAQEEHEVEVPDESATDDAKPMDADESTAEGSEKTEDKAAADKKPKMKKVKEMKTVTRTKKHNCTVTTLWSSGHTMESLGELVNAEKQMKESDANIKATQESKNNLESYIYDMRSKTSDSGELVKWAQGDEIATFHKALQAAEDWLYGDGDDSSKEEYLEKMAEVQKAGSPITGRLAAFLEEERKKKEEAERKAKEEAEAKRKAEEEAKKKADEEAKAAAEAAKAAEESSAAPADDAAKDGAADTTQEKMDLD